MSENIARERRRLGREEMTPEMEAGFRAVKERSAMVGFVAGILTLTILVTVLGVAVRVFYEVWRWILSP